MVGESNKNVFLNSDRRFDYRRIRDIRVWDIESRLYINKWLPGQVWHCPWHSVCHLHSLEHHQPSPGWLEDHWAEKANTKYHLLRFICWLCTVIINTYGNSILKEDLHSETLISTICRLFSMVLLLFCMRVCAEGREGCELYIVFT